MKKGLKSNKFNFKNKNLNLDFLKILLAKFLRCAIKNKEKI